MKRTRGWRTIAFIGPDYEYGRGMWADLRSKVDEVDHDDQGRPRSVAETGMAALLGNFKVYPADAFCRRQKRLPAAVRRSLPRSEP